MVEVWLPYGKTEVPVRIPDENLLGLLGIGEIKAVEKPSEEVLRAIDNPIGSSKLDEIADPSDKIAIVVDDEQFPSNLVLPLLVNKLNSLGINDSNITIIPGYTTQSSTEPDYKKSLITEDLAKRVKLSISSPDSGHFTYVGDTRRGTKVYIKDEFLEADLRILTGRIGFHPFAGYSGGRSGVFPAICGPETIQRSGILLLDPKAEAGNLEGNPVHQEMEEIAHMAKVNFIVNAVLSSGGGVVKAVAGDVDQAFLEGVKFVDERFRVSVERAADVVVFSSGGYPWDTTLHSACSGLKSALNIVKNDGVLIWVAECPRGYGSGVFYDWMSRFKSVDEAAVEVKRSFMPGGDMAYLLLKALKRARIILVSIIPDYYATGVFGLRTARTVNTALKSAFRILGKEGKVLVLPNSNTVLPVIKK